MKKTDEKPKDNPVVARRKELVDKIIAMMEKDGFFNNPEEWNRLAFAPHNPLSGTIYHGCNRIRLMFEAYQNHYDDPRWATFNQISAAGYKIKKGSHGIPCEKWSFYKEQTVKDENGKPVKDADGKTIKQLVELEHPVCRMFTVFHASQIEGFPELDLPQEVLKSDIFDLSDQLIAVSECPVKEIPQSRAFYSRLNDEIVLPPRQIFKDAESFLKTLIHESAHSTGAEGRLNRQHGNTFGDAAYAKEELIAEIASLFIESDLGVNLRAEHFEDHSDYLKSWLGALKQDYTVFFQAVGEADKAAARIVGNYRRVYQKDIALTDKANTDVQDLSETGISASEKEKSAQSDKKKSELKKERGDKLDGGWKKAPFPSPHRREL